MVKIVQYDFSYQILLFSITIKKPLNKIIFKYLLTWPDHLEAQKSLLCDPVSVNPLLNLIGLQVH